VVAVYAKASIGLATWPSSTRLAQRWSELTSGLHTWFAGQDVRRSEAEHLLGPPSLAVDNGTVLCYAPADARAGWLFVDCPRVSVSRYEAEAGRYTTDTDADPLVRSVRTSGRKFEAGLILTLYGSVLRSGPDC
jgi:hypothetical protein